VRGSDGRDDGEAAALRALDSCRMFRLFYRYTRRNIRLGFTEDYLAGQFFQDATKWWFDFSRNLIIASLFAYFAERTGSWLAYGLAHLSFVFFTWFLFQPIFRFILKASHSSLSKQRRDRVTVMSMTWFLFIFSFGIGAAGFVIDAMAKFQAR
jgi:hypothetical protein